MPRRSFGIVAAPWLLAAALVACGDDGVDADAERFCGEARAQQARIANPPVASEAELEQSLEFFRAMGELAPLEISEQWGDIVLAMETASTVVPSDPESVERAAVQAYATERSAYEVKVWLQRYCGVDIPITTIAPQDPLPAGTTTTTSLPGAAGSAPATTTPPTTPATTPA
jgi:hypothetical protein